MSEASRAAAYRVSQARRVAARDARLAAMTGNAASAAAVKAAWEPLREPFALPTAVDARHERPGDRLEV